MLNLKRIRETVSQNQENVGIFIPSGITENVELEGVEVKMTPTGTEVFQATFKKDNKRNYMTEWLHPEDPTERQEPGAARIMHLLSAFLPEEALDRLEAENIKDLAQKAVVALDSTKHATKLRIKFVYVKDKVTTPRYSKFTWVESMTIPKEESKIQWMSNIDSDKPEQMPQKTEKDQKK